MYASNEAFVALNKAQVESFVAAARAGFDAAERLARLNLEAASGLARHGIAALHSATQGRLPEADTNATSDYSRRLLQIFQDLQGQMVHLTDESLARFSREVLEASEKSLVHGAFPGGDTAVTGLRNAVGAATSSLDAFQQMFRQVTDFAEASLKTVSPAAPAAADAGKAAARRKAA